MKKITVFAAPIMVAAVMTAPATAEVAEPSKGEIKLAKMLEGREAGEPTSCVRLFPTSNLTVIDGTALVYKQGGTLYVNVPRDPDNIDQHDTLVTRPFGNRLCKTDIVTTIDPFTGFNTGNIYLSEFVPYKKIKKDV